MSRKIELEVIRSDESTKPDYAKEGVSYGEAMLALEHGARVDNVYWEDGMYLELHKTEKHLVVTEDGEVYHELRAEGEVMGSWNILNYGVNSEGDSVTGLELCIESELAKKIGA